MVKIGNNFTREFWTKVGVKQGCALSPTLFSIYINEIEEVLAKGRSGGIKMGGDRLWSLAYADDLVLLAENREGMEAMMKSLGRFLKNRKLKLNTEK